MPTLKSIMDELNRKGTEQTRKTFVRHGAHPGRTLGVSVADLKLIAKTIAKSDGAPQDLAYQLFDTGILEAQYLAGMVARGGPFTRKQLQAWANAADTPMISEHTVPWVAVENAAGRDLALEWMQSKHDHVQAAGWRTYAGLMTITPDNALDLREVEGLLQSVVSGIGKATNRARYCMNGFLIAAGSYVTPLQKQAVAAAKKVGNVSVDMGDTACEIPLATAQLARMEASGRLGVKRKTIRC